MHNWHDDAPLQRQLFEFSCEDCGRIPNFGDTVHEVRDDPRDPSGDTFFVCNDCLPAYLGIRTGRSLVIVKPPTEVCK